MNKEEAIRMLKAKLECMTRDVSGRDNDCINRRCDECSLNYEQGNMGEQKEWLRMAIKALEEQPSEDCISRQAVIDALHRYFADGFDGDKWWNSTHVLDAVNRVPSATPQPKTGHWIWCASSHKCSNCGEYVCFSHKKLLKYCPECGAKMEVQK